jgi:hypothetical protein
MGINAILTVNFKEEAPLEKRTRFIASLSRDYWEKSPEAEDRWTATFKNNVTGDAAMNVVKHDVDRASKKADILNYEALIKLGDGPQESFGPFYSAEYLSVRASTKQECEK